MAVEEVAAGKRRVRRKRRGRSIVLSRRLRR